MAKVPLHVRYRGRRVGTLERHDDARITFTYSDSWSSAADAFPISLSLPLGRPPLSDRAANLFFSNLLPEGLVRQRICRELKVHVDDDIALLEKIGGDCAGALSITTGDEPTRDDEYEAISESQLSAWSKGATPVLPAVSGVGRVRLSLAGAQDKLPVMIDSDGFWLPVGNSPSTHILKFETVDFKHLPANETYTTLIGKKLGLLCVDVALHRTEAEPLSIIKRYDRHCSETRVERLHQEDMCQALAISPLEKYESSGGPSIVRCMGAAREHCSQPFKAIDALLKWIVFNVVTGNADAHGKNLSFLFTRSGEVRIAPFYDLVCTRAYERIDRTHAMSIGGSFDADTITPKRWESTGRDVGVRPRLMVATARDFAERAADAAKAATADFVDRFGTSPAVKRIERIVRKRSKRLLSLM